MLGNIPTSQFPGVHWDKRENKWMVRIRLAGRRVHLGYFDVEKDAAEAYVRAKTIHVP